MPNRWTTPYPSECSTWESIHAIGMPDYVHGIRHAAFHTHGTEGGNISPDGRMIVDSGLFNADLLKADYGRKAGKLFDGPRLRDRLDPILRMNMKSNGTASATSRR